MISVVPLESSSGSAEAMSIRNMTRVRLTPAGKDLASKMGICSADISYNEFIVFPDANSDEISIVGMCGQGFKCSRHRANIIESIIDM